METCPDCRNVLPRTVDRCPVCGLVRRADEPVEPTVEVIDDGTPGWVHTESSESPSVGLSPDDFLRELGADPDDEYGDEDAPAASLDADPFAPDQPTRPQRPTRRSRTNPAPAPDPILAAEAGTQPWEPEPVPQDFATALAAAEPVAEPTPNDVPPQPVAAAPAPPPTPPVSAERPLQAEPVRTAVAADRTRSTQPESIAAASTRVQGNVKVGPTPNHQLVTVGHGVAAIILLLLGLVLAYPGVADESEDSAPVESIEVPDELTLAYGVPIADIEATADAAVVSLTLDGCGLTATATAVVLDERTVLARRSDLITDVRPTIVRADGSTVGGRVIGWSTPRDLAVIRTFGDLTGGAMLGGETRVQEGTGVFVVDLTDGIDYELQPLPVLALQGRNGVVTKITLDTDAVPGSPVLDTAGLMVATIGRTGEATLAGDLRSWVSRLITTEENPRAICPPPPVMDGDEDGAESGN